MHICKFGKKVYLTQIPVGRDDPDWKRVRKAMAGEAHRDAEYAAMVEGKVRGLRSVTN